MTAGGVNASCNTWRCACWHTWSWLPLFTCGSGVWFRDLKDVDVYASPNDFEHAIAIILIYFSISRSMLCVYFPFIHIHTDNLGS